MLTGGEIEKIEDKIYVLQELRKDIKKAKLEIPDGKEGYYYSDIEDGLDDVLNLISYDIEENEIRLKEVVYDG